MTLGRSPRPHTVGDAIRVRLSETDRKLQYRTERALEAEAAAREGYPKAVERATRKEVAHRRKFDLPPLKTIEDPNGWDDRLVPSTPRDSWYKDARANLNNSAYGAFVLDAPPVDKAFNKRKPQKWTRTVQLTASPATDWTVSSWAIGSCAPLLDGNVGVGRLVPSTP